MKTDARSLLSAMAFLDNPEFTRISMHEPWLVAATTTDLEDFPLVLSDAKFSLEVRGSEPEPIDIGPLAFLKIEARN